ncbi:hypothetical protein CRE_21078 [Caenorhabditis remanei]|uniref:Serpentine receptor class r-10 n=2 Tax=Caenorhabditis remanei TaxID=31234 RepID=E3NS49_CAERE|nr:hypothetical protein CRE_21078 [Caenorhabditis remanei]
MGWISLIKSYIQLVTVVFSLFVNSIFIFLVVTKSPKKLGNYKHLMCYFSFISMVYAILDYIVQPYIHSYRASFSMLMDLKGSAFENNPTVAFFLTASLTGCFASTIYAISINFVFRYFALQREGRLRYFSGKRLYLWISIPFLSGLAWVTNNWFLFSPNPEMTEYLRAEVKELYDLDADKMTYTGCLYWRTDVNGNIYLSKKDLIGAFNLIIIMMIPFFTILYFGSKSYSKITKLMSQGESDYSRKLQMQLYKALVAQTLIPMVFLFIPVGIFFTSPLLGVNIEWASFIITFFYSFYPAVDPIPIIMLIDEYRNAFFNFFRRAMSKNQVVSVVSIDLNYT